VNLVVVPGVQDLRPERVEERVAGGIGEGGAAARACLRGPARTVSRVGSAAPSGGRVLRLGHAPSIACYGAGA